MKDSVYLAFLILFCFSCEDVISVDLPTSETRLVIDALIGYNDNNGDILTAGQVKLSLTAPFFEENVPAAENATVSIIDEFNGDQYSLSESEPGMFTIGFPDLQFGREYTLEVTYQGETYRATEHLMRAPLIDNLEQGDGFLFDEEEETEVKITFTDLIGERNRYLFSFGFNNFLVIDDEFFQDQQLTFSYFYEDIQPGRLVAVTVFGIDQQFANYAEQALAQSGEDDGGGPFATPTATIRGNLVNTTNPDNFAFGYFAISEFDTALLTIE
ncbi:MAG: DUF4249 family protein [Bacteroidota bacterium]